MLPQPETAEPDPDQATGNAQYYLRVIHRLIDLGASLAERIQLQPVNQAEQTTPGLEPDAATVSLEFDRTVRGVRRSILLAQRIQDPPAPPARPGPAQHRTLVRQRILRQVEDELHDSYPDSEAEALHHELLERLDSPELEDEIGTRPADDILTDIRRDLGIASMYGMHSSWKRRTPSDVAALHARAASPPASAAIAARLQQTGRLPLS